MSELLTKPQNNDYWQNRTLFTKPVIISMLVLVSGIMLFMSLNVSADWQFVLAFRGKKLLALLVVAYAIGVSTLLFQTITHNNILTPSLLGFDALYVLLQSLLVFLFGAVDMPALPKFGMEITIMVVMSLLLFKLLFANKYQHDLTRLILVGIIFGVLFRSFSSLIARLIDPNDFLMVQSASFAQFNTVNSHILALSLFICLVTGVLLWRWRHACDVLLLGREQVINLGIDYQALIMKLLVVIAILVAMATAFVGPVVFLGLLVCAITNRISLNMYHGERLLLVSLVAMVCLVFGQAVFEHVFGMAGVLSVVIELLGGLVFLALIYQQAQR